MRRAQDAASTRQPKINSAFLEVVINPDQNAPFGWTSLLQDAQRLRYGADVRGPVCYIPRAKGSVPHDETAGPFLPAECVGRFVWTITVEWTQAVTRLLVPAWIKALGQTSRNVYIRWKSSDDRDIKVILEELDEQRRPSTGLQSLT